MVDDRVGLRGRHKLAGQLAVASILIPSGLLIQRIGLFGVQIEMGLLAVPFTLFWLVGAMNALNLLDGVDGLATTLGIILSLAIAAMAAMAHHPAVAVVAVVFAGSLLGFLRYNFPPASIFLGDAGSMLIGLMVGAMAIRSSLKGPGTVLLAAPMAILAIPILDSSMAILRRKLTGRSIYATDRGHLHHQLLSRLGSNRKVLAWIGIIAVLTSAIALLTSSLKSDSIALVSCLGLVGIFVATGIFGRGEFFLLAGRLANIGRSLVQPLASRTPSSRQTAVHLRGSRQWQQVWDTLIDSAENLHLDSVHLDLNHPAAQEEFNATWQRPSFEDSEFCWRLDLPLILNKRTIGRLKIGAERNGESACQRMAQVLEIIRPLEKEIHLLLEEAESPCEGSQHLHNQSGDVPTGALAGSLEE
jgi:UDP-GlcNAc:undecaprenyl-phosphate GlcNAc-1-phosphate transferase